ncbi:Crinkler (CRN) family protein [Thraustotheca clavata]|uniref:Crinkler (CRN) family protein n=1 Tax=Thraustotheca clavata TaxID=74557 RepID=A0A1V9YSE5_9STRA|nr:Crinkler (CRN) family protein [Thraustotheca clavata]
MAILYTNVNLDNEKTRKKCRCKVPAPSIHFHFANLVNEHFKHILAQDGTMKTQNNQIQCNWSPNYTDQITQQKISTKKIFSMSTLGVGKHGSACNLFFLEMVLLAEFQNDVWFEVQMIEQSNRRIWAASDFVYGYPERLSTKNIPFLAPPNAEWPWYVMQENVNGCNFGNLVWNPIKWELYIQDSDRKEEDAEKKRVMKSFMQGLNEKRDITFLFCMKMESFVWNYSSTGCVKINCRQREVEWIFQPAKTCRERLVIVVEVEH